MTKNWHRSILRKMPSCPPRKEFLHMHLPVVILLENQYKIWYMRHREKLFWIWQKKNHA